MTFSSLVFLFCFLPVFFALYYATPSRYRNYFAVAGSMAFYMWEAPRFVFVLLGASAFDYTIAKLIHRRKVGDPARKRLLQLSVITNLLILFYFKYANFFVAQVQDLLASFGAGPVPWVAVALPIGISFFTFHKVSYIADVYNNTVEPAKDFPTFALYIFLFPQLIAGPIIRYHDICDQFVARQYSINILYQGLVRFCIGLAKKILIADQVSSLADKMFATDLNTMPTSFIWLGIIAYAYQIYFDFSGYSDMAIGLGKMMGFRFPENFNQPYTAVTITDFWRRWHMTLSSWMREYLYIPLGGNRGGTWHTYKNLWTVFLLSGLWHGASWSFIFWGAFHGMFLVIDKLFWIDISKHLPRLVNVTVTFIVVLIGWVFFRADTLGHALSYLQHMWGLSGIDKSSAEVELFSLLSHRAGVMMVVATLICALPLIPSYSRIRAQYLSSREQPARVMLEGLSMAMLLTLSVIALANAKFVPFIYFRF